MNHSVNDAGAESFPDDFSSKDSSEYRYDFAGFAMATQKTNFAYGSATNQIESESYVFAASRCIFFGGHSNKSLILGLLGRGTRPGLKIVSESATIAATLAAAV
jgi:hypothetical protein